MNPFISWNTFCDWAEQHYQVQPVRSIADPATPLWKVIERYPAIPIQQEQLLGGKNLSFTPIERIKQLAVTGLFSFGIFFPIAWFFSDTLLSKRLGGSVLSKAIENHPYFKGEWTNQSIQTLPGADAYGEDPFRGAVSIDNHQPLWLVTLLTSFTYWIFHWITFLTQIQTNRNCDIPHVGTVIYQFFAMLFPFVAIGISNKVDQDFNVSSRTNFQGKQEWWSYWSTYSMIITVVIMGVLLFWNAWAQWNSCALSFWVIAFVGAIVAGVYFMMQWISDPWLQLLRKVAVVFGVHVEEGQEEQSFFVRYGWIWTIGLPIYVVAAFTYALLYVKNNAAIC